MNDTVCTVTEMARTYKRDTDGANHNTIFVQTKKSTAKPCKSCALGLIANRVYTALSLTHTHTTLCAQTRQTASQSVLYMLNI